jgi:mannose-1-phosphate guanylyltransferase
MNALILAAGRGSRLGDITRDIPKPLLEVGGQPILQRHLEMCLQAGVTDVCINTHYLAEAIRSFVGDGSRFGLRVHFSYETELLGTAGALQNFREPLGSAPFLVIYGDNVLSLDVADFARFHREKNALMTIALHHREDVSTSGMVVVDARQRITDFIEKPARELQVSHLVNAGIYLCEPSIFDWIPPGAPDFGKDIIPALLRAEQLVFGYTLDTEVIAVDTPELLQKARAR